MLSPGNNEEFIEDSEKTAADYKGNEKVAARSGRHIVKGQGADP